MKIFLSLTACYFLIAIVAWMTTTKMGLTVAVTLAWTAPGLAIPWFVIFIILLVNMFVKRSRAKEAETVSEAL